MRCAVGTDYVAAAVQFEDLVSAEEGGLPDHVSGDEEMAPPAETLQQWRDHRDGALAAIVERQSERAPAPSRTGSVRERRTAGTANLPRRLTARVPERLQMSPEVDHRHLVKGGAIGLEAGLTVVVTPQHVVVHQRHQLR